MCKQEYISRCSDGAKKSCISRLCIELVASDQVSLLSQNDTKPRPDKYSTSAATSHFLWPLFKLVHTRRKA